MNKFYHITPTKNLKSILKNGLIPKIGDRSRQIEADSGIYLFNSLMDVNDALTNWLGEEFDEDVKLALLEISLNEPFSQNHYETVINYIISPEYIKVLTKDIDNFIFNESVKLSFKDFIKIRDLK